MGSNYNDDEPITSTLQHDLGKRPEDFVAGKISARFINKPDAPLEKTDYRLIVQLMGSETSDQRCGVDIVTVLDVSGSMDGQKLNKLKEAMKFLVKKLTSIDRLSIVTFNIRASRLSGLTAMGLTGQEKVEKLIDGLIADGRTNIAPGLEIALKVLRDRTQSEGRTSAIMLMSDGELTKGVPHPSTVSAGAVPVYTFGLGKDHDSEVLEGIARRSNKGTYSVADVDGSDSASLNIAFSSCLAGLLSVVVEDLKLTITPLSVEINEVRVGNYDQVPDDDAVVISFGNLYNREKRKSTVFLTLPAISNSSRSTSDIVRIAYSFRPSGGGELFEAPPLFAGVTRTSNPVSVEPSELINEVARADTADAMKSARELADDKRFDEAKTTLKDAEKSLDALNRERDDLIMALKYEVQEFFRLLKDPETYRKKGRAFALSSELCHGLQRFAARGDATQLLALAIPLAAVYVKQAKKFDEDPTIEVPTAEEDRKEVIEILPPTPNPIVELADTLNHHIGQAIESLKAIQDLIKALQKS